jgi:prevent-host-death family protein
MTERTISATEARVHFGELMRDVVTQHQTVVVERGGKPQIVLLSVEEYARLKANAGADVSWEEMVDDVRARIAAEAGDVTLPPAVEVVRQGREARGDELANLR